jgi:predicted ATPase
MQVSMSMSNVLFWMGELPRSLDFSADVVRYYEASNTQEFNVRYAQNPRITTMNSRVWSTWLMGHPTRAKNLADETITLADALAHPFNKAISIQILAFLHLYRHDAQACYTAAQELMSFAQKHGFMIYSVLGDIFSGWALAEIEPETGIDKFKAAMGRWEGMGAKLGNSIFFALLAELYLRGRDFTALHAALDAGFAHVEQTSEKVYLAELYRVRGTAYFEQGNSVEAKIALEQARKIAQDQSAVMLELRALITLALQSPSDEVTGRMAELLSQVDPKDWQEPVILTAQSFLP